MEDLESQSVTSRNEYIMLFFKGKSEIDDLSFKWKEAGWENKRISSVEKVNIPLCAHLCLFWMNLRRIYNILPVDNCSNDASIPRDSVVQKRSTS